MRLRMCVCMCVWLYMCVSVHVCISDFCVQVIPRAYAYEFMWGVGGRCVCV